MLQPVWPMELLKEHSTNKSYAASCGFSPHDARDPQGHALRYSVNHLLSMLLKLSRKWICWVSISNFGLCCEANFHNFHYFSSVSVCTPVWSVSLNNLELLPNCVSNCVSTGQGGEPVECAAGRASWRSLPMPSVIPHVLFAARDVFVQTLPTSTPRGCCSNLRLHARRNCGAEGRGHWFLAEIERATAATVFLTDITRNNAK